MFSEMFIEIYFKNSDNFLDMTDALKNGDIEKFKFYSKIQEFLMSVELTKNNFITDLYLE